MIHQDTCINPKYDSNSSIWHQDQREDFLNCCVQMIKIINEVSGEFSMSRFGTLDNEHLFAQIRAITQGNTSATMTNLAIKKLYLLDILMKI